MVYFLGSGSEEDKVQSIPEPMTRQEDKDEKETVKGLT
jgi:hypothetical protein